MNIVTVINQTIERHSSSRECLTEKERQMNKVQLMGRLTREPELRYSQASEPVAIARFDLAVRRQYSPDGQPDVDFLRCVAFGNKAEFIGEHFAKGQQVAVTGHIQTGSYENKDGFTVYTTDIVIEETHFAESKKAQEAIAYVEKLKATKGKAKTTTKKKTATRKRNDGFVPVVTENDTDELPF